MQAEKSILYLTLKKEFFDAILSGEKTAEYREYKEYWIKRLINKDGGFKYYDLIHFKNGYNKDAPWFIIEFKGIIIIKEKISWFKFAKYFKIELGRVVEKSNKVILK